MHQAGSGDLLADRRFAYAEACLAEGDCVGAAEMAEQALERAPRFAAAWVLLGRAREARHAAEAAAGAADPALFQAALRAYETGRDLDPEDTLGTLVHLARIAGDAALPVLSPAYLRALFDGYAGRFERHLVEGLGYCGPALLCAALDAYDGSREPPRGSFSQGEKGGMRGVTSPDSSHPSPQFSPAREREPGGAPRYGHAIDLGCGTGLMGAALGARVGTLTGVDIAPAMLALARRKGLYARLVEAGIEDFLAGEPAASADLCVAADVFIYLGPLATVLSGMTRVLRPDGRAAFTVQSHDGDGVVLGPDGRYAHADAYLAAAAEAAGFGDLAIRSAVVRRENGADVPGRTVIAVKRSASTGVEAA
ncbi:MULTISPECIES: methyltransferase domain-containing protein [Methylobacterium]|nr:MULTISPECIES: methyltransferase domain-containing protein [Methylobacterium]TXM73214.1 methyltransferase domain-containing protein [Methylobacterium sp. WL12]TXN80729.1 methyltransferase domain-containing protein [Methylobacterium sp. WL8]